MRIQHNIPAMAAYRNYTNNTSAVSKNLEKLSSGYKINRAGDDAAGLAVSEKMRAQITGLEAAQKNAKDGISLVQTAEGALTEVHDMLNRMYELAELSSNGTYQDEVDRENYQKEIESLRTEINRIAESVNFNGITLLNGDLASEKAVSKIEIGGNASGTKSLGDKASFEMNAAYTALTGTQVKGGTLEFSVGYDDGTATNIKLTFAEDDNGDVKKLIAEDGTEYSIAAADGKATVAELDNIFTSELKKKLSDEFKVDVASNKIKLTALENGTSGRQVRSFDIVSLTKDGTQLDKKDIGVTVTSGKNDGLEIDASTLTLYDGTNADDAIFTINGHKFVLMVGENAFAGATPNVVDTMNATMGLGPDVTVLISDGTTKNGLKAADANFNQNIDKIAEVTGLNVGDAINETVNGTATATGVAPGAGIRLSLSDTKAKGKGLVLQIGDTADDFNKMTVSISDMHADAMGIGSISVATQDGSSDAMKKIKDAINYVSSTRGDLGALQNRLDHTINNLSVMQENIQDAESTIRDVDIAKEMMAYTKNNILVQSAQAMLAQANQLPQGVLQLLQ